MSLGTPFVIGIDLGTTNTAVAYIDLRRESAGYPSVELFPVPQVVAPGRVEERPLLPSFVYLPAEFEFPAASLALPWDERRAYAVGEFARQHGASVPGRLVSSAKSWLCHSGVDRRAAILPWGAGEGIPQISPVEASARVLKHIREAWDYHWARTDTSCRFSAQEVVLTVPASFDEVARELTCEAAKAAGFGQFTLLEEPQAAFYYWIRENEGRWSNALGAGGTILVCDIGGGTTDLSLIRATVKDGEPPAFERLAVGAHLLLGGDNMDLTLARWLEAETGRVGALGARQWTQLAHRCREAKEALLASPHALPVQVSVPGATSRVIGGALSREIDVALADQILLGGFFPHVQPEEAESKRRRAGIQEFGLPFESDPAIPRHILRFLKSQSPNVPAETQERGLVRPHAILFNGGATRAAKVQDRLVDVVSAWFSVTRSENPEWSPRVLVNSQPDLAVALGAAWYGAVRRGHGVRIRGGSARAYYVGVGLAGTGGASGGTASSTVAHVLCILPHGLEEGREVTVPQVLELTANSPARFPLWASSTRLADVAGQVVDVGLGELEPLPPIHAALQFGKKGAATTLPVRVVARVTEIGTLALELASTHSSHRWKLEFDLRGAQDPRGGSSAQPRAESAAPHETFPEEAVERARAAVEAVFLHNTADPTKLIRAIEVAWDRTRDTWPPSALRALWSTLIRLAPQRGRNAELEARWYNLAGFLLRPGRGRPGDELRVRELWAAVWGQGVINRSSSQVWREWWVLWRRVAAGLTEGQQTQLFGQASPLLMAKKVDTFKAGRPAPDPAELQEIWFAAASLERIAAASRVKLGDVAIKFLPSKMFDRFGVWALGRLGARQPLYAGAQSALAPAVAERWLKVLLDERWKAVEGNLLDAVQLARFTGDRSRDLSVSARSAFGERLKGAAGGAALQRWLEEAVEPDSKQTDHLLGDALPPGLILIHDS